MKSLNVLIVDDNVSILQSLVGFFNTDSSFSVISWSFSLEEVLQKLELYNFDVVFVDLTFKYMNGFDLTKKIKEISPSTHVIILSFYDNNEYKEQALLAGADALIEKSSIAENLSTVLAAVFSETEI